MINNLSYEQILTISAELKKNCEIIKQLTSLKKIQDLEEFITSVEIYYKYLENAVELSKDADIALQDLINNKK